MCISVEINGFVDPDLVPGLLERAEEETTGDEEGGEAGEEDESGEEAVLRQDIGVDETEEAHF